MKIEIVAQGDPDTKSFTRTFHYPLSDEVIFQESTLLIKKRLSNNMKLNINEALELFAAFIKTSIDEGKSINEILKYIPKLLSENQVLIGVPESLRQLTFRIMTEEENKIVHIISPIHIKRYIFHESTHSA